MQNYEVQITQQAGTVQCDFETAKKYLNSRLEEFRGVLFTEDSKKEAKDTIATLRKEKKAFLDRVKEVKTEYMKPFEAFWEKAMELAELYEEPINFINGQVAEFEKKRVEEKKALIRGLYEECISGLGDLLPLEKLYNPKWENATATAKSIREELMTRKEAVKTALAAIRQFHSEAEEKAIQLYLTDFDLPKALLYVSQYEQQKQEIREREQQRIRREEEEKIRREERERLEAQLRAQEEKEALLRQAEEEKQAAVEQARAETAQEVVDSFLPTDLDGETGLFEYRMSLTADQKEKLETYMDSVGIEWERT